MTNGATAILVSVMVAFLGLNTTLIVFLFRQIGKTERSLRADMKADMNAGYDRLKAYMNAGFDRLQAGQDNLKAEIGDLSRRVSNLEADVAALKSDVAALKSDVAVLKADVTALKSDVTVLKADVTALKSNVMGWTPIIMALIARSVSAGETALASEPAPPPAVSEPDSG